LAKADLRFVIAAAAACGEQRYRFGKSAPVNPLHKSKHIPFLPAGKAVKRLPLRIDDQRGMVIIMKRTKPHQFPPSLLQLHVLPNYPANTLTLFYLSTIHIFLITNYELRITNFIQLRITNQLRISFNYELRITNYEQKRTSCRPSKKVRHVDRA
jgi:hypothetical protein